MKCNFIRVLHETASKKYGTEPPFVGTAAVVLTLNSSHVINLLQDRALRTLYFSVIVIILLVL